VLCEGFTEYLYTKSLQAELPRHKQRAISVDVFQGKQSDIKNLVLDAKRRALTAKKERNAYEVIWLFFDHDNQPKLREAFEMIEKEGFKIAYSAICIEHWFILHFENCGKAFTSGEEALKHLKKHMPAYHKTKTNAFVELRDKLNVAIQRAKTINSTKVKSVTLAEHNPFFTISDLYSYFEQLKLR
jgi:hypothetical protein